MTIDVNDPDQQRPLVEKTESPVAAASLAAEALRWVMHRISRLHSAGDVYNLIGQQVIVLERIPQALEAERAWLQRYQAALKMGEVPGPPASDRVQAVRTTLALARQEIESATRLMRRAQSLVAPLYGPEKADAEAEGGR